MRLRSSNYGYLSYNLREANFTVIKSSDGIDALNKIKSENPDIAILDIMITM